MEKMKAISSLDELNLFPSQNIRLTNSIDRYGFSYDLANYFGMTTPRRSFCNWVHGWIWWEDLMKPEDILGVTPFTDHIPIIVGSANEKRLILDEKYKSDVYVGGLPYVYCPEFNVQKCKDTLLAVLAHSSEGEIHEVSDENYLDYLYSIKDNWKSIYVLIYYLDKSKKLISEIEARGLKFIIGANPHDRYSLQRTKLIFSLADAVNANVMGSHIAYALASNCKVSFVDNLYRYEPSVSLNANGMHLSDVVERNLFVASAEYLKSRYKFLFIDPSEGSRNIQLGKKYIGQENKIDSNELKNIIGWNLSNQLNGYFKGFFNRAKKMLATKS